ncbi:DUF4256 domain-containing protein [Ferruginibacter yonginensis]|uniref:DUF4256 domain-containing protein n=1 Tax=Ferruginibacter yonginensis TaxID=1310416 RepID=A0ABV8QU68_9BACT
MPQQQTITKQQKEALLQTLQQRFQKNMHRHKNINWTNVEAKLITNPTALWSIYQMELTDGEPDVIDYDKKNDRYLWVDAATETPKSRCSLCYDKAAWDARKENKPKGNAVDAATALGITLIDETTYKKLQQCQPVDTKTSSWLLSPPAIRKLGGAIFGDNRYQQVFIYHNGVQSYYAGRGFRGMLWV